MKIALRLLTVLGYFLPLTFYVVTCDGVDVKFAYNQEEADTHKLLAESYRQKVAEEDTLLEGSNSEVLVDSANADHLSQPKVESLIRPELHNHGGSAPSDTTNPLQHSKEFWDDIGFRAMVPTENSLSGVGSIFFFKNLTGQILIAISLLISLFGLFAFSFLKSHRLKKLLLLSNILLLLIFVFVGIISDVTLRWGAIAVPFLIIVQLAFELRSERSRLATLPKL